LPHRRFTILRIAQTIPKAEFEAAHCRTAGNVTLANHQPSERRNGSGDSPPAYLLIIALFIPDRFANLNNAPTFKKVGI
jgi:hypothetical protein